MEQLDLLVALAEQDRDAALAEAESRGPLEGYRHRYNTNQLIPGESCPACGHLHPGRVDGSRNHYLMADGICIGMSLTRSHMLGALRSGERVEEYRARAIRAGWPAETVQAWIDDPSLLRKELP